MQTGKLAGDLGATVRDAEKGLEWGDKALERFAADRFWQLIEMHRSVANAPAVSRMDGEG